AWQPRPGSGERTGRDARGRRDTGDTHRRHGHRRRRLCGGIMGRVGPNRERRELFLTVPGSVTLSHPRRRSRLRRGRAEPAVWIAPAVAVVVFVFGYSMFELVKTASRFEGAWTFDNFRLTWSDPSFKTALGHNARLLLAVPALVVLALLLSVLLYEGLR